MPSNLRGTRFAVLLGVSALSLAVGRALADPAPPFPLLLDQSRATAPTLAEAEADVGQAEGLAMQAAARPNPTISLEVENFSGTGPFRGLGGSETTASVEQPLELGGKRGARMAAGEAAVLAARAKGSQVWFDYAAGLADAYIQAEASEVRVRLAADALVLAEEDARVADALVRAGKEANVRAVQARAAVESARAGLEEARAAQEAAFGRLTAMAGFPGHLTATAGSLLAHADREEVAVLPDALRSPAYLTALAARDAAAKRVRMEATRAAPDVTVSFGVRRLAGDDATAMVGGVSAPLPLFDRNRGGVSAAKAELRAAEARLNAARLDAEADSRTAARRLEASQARLRAAKAGEDAATEAYRLTRIGYEGGKLPLTDLLSARRLLVEARLQTLDARLERLSAEVALARLGGAVPFGDLK